MRAYFIGLLLLVALAGKAQHIAGSWSGEIDAGIVKLNLVINIVKDKDGKEICLMDSPDQGVKGVPTDLLYISADSLSVAVPMIGAKYNGKLVGNKINGVFEQMGQKISLCLEQKVLQYRRPQHPVPPYPYDTAEVTFENVEAGAILAGTLTYPVGYKTGDRVPVVLMVTGSGPENRDEEIFEHKPFLVLADFLARNGIATLRYDDRAVGKSTGKGLAATTLDVAADASAGVEFLRKRPQFSSVGVLGHSEGATVAFMLGAKHQIDFAVSMAGIGVKGTDCLYAQAKRITELSGGKYPMTKEQFVEMARAQKNPWMEYFLDYEAQADIEQTVCPVLALNGDKDVQVIASLNLEAITRYLPKNKKTKVKLYPGLNHLFQECQTGLPQEYSRIEQTVSPIVMQDIADWIKSL